MNKAEKENKAKSKVETEACRCPFCCGKRVLEQKKEKYDKFFGHLRNARIEVLQAFRSLIDQKITSLQTEKRKVTKVKVE